LVEKLGENWEKIVLVWILRSAQIVAFGWVPVN